MKVLTWNINGIRASNRETPLKQLLDQLQADIVCLQETKVTRDQLDEATAVVDGYHAFFSFSRVKGGYSGVVTYCKTTCTPVAVEEGLTGRLTEGSCSTAIHCYANERLSLTTPELASLDDEGRAILSEHNIAGFKPLVIVNVYCPRADRENEERWTYKQNFYKLVQARCEELLNSRKSVMIVGDLNVSHTRLDHCDPDADPEYFSSNESRIWMSDFLLSLTKESANVVSSSQKSIAASNVEGNGSPSQTEDEKSFLVEELHTIGDTLIRSSVNDSSTLPSKSKTKNFVDLFRYFHPNREYAFTCWSTKTSARKTNYGTRIDYVIVDDEFLLNHAVSCDIRPDIHGSDHCPVAAVFSCNLEASCVIPGLCSAFMPEFKGKQRSIKAFLKAGCPRSYSNPEDSLLERNSPLGKAPRGGSFADSGGERSMKRKASDKMSAKQSKIQKRDSKTQKTGKQAGVNIKSYFHRPKFVNEQSDAISKDLRNFLKEAQVTDVSLQNDIVRDLTGRSGDHSFDRSITASQELASEGNLPLETKPAEGSDDTASPSNLSVLEDCKKLDDSSGKVGRNKTQWKSILKGPDPPPLCEGHKEECVLRTVKKQGVNLGKQFYCCARPEGRPTDKEARCKTFLWKKK